MKYQSTYTDLSDPEILLMTGVFLNNLANNLSLIDELKGRLVGYDQLKQAHDRMQGSFEESQSGTPEKVLALKEDRKSLNLLLAKFKEFVQVTAGDDPATLVRAGYQVQKAKAAPAAVTLAACTNIRIGHGDGHGVMLIKCSSFRGAKSYVVEICEGDPTIEANWRYCTVSGICSKIEITGLVPGTVYSFRVRGVRGNSFGPWSTIVTLMAI
jgi:hypothetical protein